jgi:hypothetical protein
MMSLKCLVFSWALVALSMACYEVIVGCDDTFLFLCLLTYGLLEPKKKLLLKLLCTQIQFIVDCNSGLHGTFSNV